MKVSVLILSLFAVAITMAMAEKKVVCYFTNWSHYRQGAGKFSPSDINAGLCTHVLYAFAVLDDQGRLKIFDAWLDVDKGHLQKVADIKNQNPSVKVLLAVGGWNAGSAQFSKMATTSSSRKVFIDSLIPMLEKYNYDGVDLDWEYPAQRYGSKPEDKTNFSYLIKELQAAFADRARSSGKPKMLVSAAVGPAAKTASAAYEKSTICSDLDFVNLMMYDIHGSWEAQTGHNAPLYATTAEATPENVIDTMTKDWINAGCARDKLILGLPLYGRSWTLRNSGNVGVGAPASGPGRQGPLTGEGGILAYHEICANLNNGWKQVYDEKAVQSMAFSGDQWVSYDNEKSISSKVDYINSMGLGGAMVWSLDSDDFTGQSCGRGKYPLLTIINNRLGKSTSPPPPPPSSSATMSQPTTTRHTRSLTTTRRPATTTTTTTTSAPTGGCEPRCDYQLRGLKYYVDRCNPQRFYICYMGVNHALSCGIGMYFDESMLACMK